MKKYLLSSLFLLLISTIGAQTVVVSYNKVKWGHGREYNNQQGEDKWQK